MSKKSDLIKSVVNETALLNRYLKSRGINPEFATKDQKVAHSKTNQFKIWARSHLSDSMTESMSSEHTPTQKRLHDLKRAKHYQQEIRVADGHKQLHSEDVEQLDEISYKALQSYRQAAHTQIQHYKYASGKDKPEAQKVLAKREPAYQKATQKVIQKNKERIAAQPKVVPQKQEPYKPLGGRDENSGRSYSEEIELNLEQVDKRDTITFDIPLLIRVLEFAREDLKSDVNLHKMVERLLNIRGRGTLTMKEYGRIVKEEFSHLSEERIDEISKDLARNYMWSAISDRNKKDEKIRTAIDKNREDFSMRRHKNISKMLHKTQKRGDGILKAIDRIQKEEVEQIDELKSSTYTSYIDKVTDPKVASTRGKTPSGTLKSIKAITGVSRAIGKRAQAQRKELGENNLDPQAACNSPWDGANNPDDVAPTKRSTASKVKLLLGDKKGMVKEELYDHEKEDKSTAPLGKKPKLQTPKEDSITKEEPQAAAVLTGGKTLTGEPRDTIEIDPMMKMRKPSPNSQKSV